MKRLLAALAVALVGIGTSGCGGSNEPAASSGSALEKPSLVLAWGKYAGNDVAYRLPEFASKYGLKVELLEVRSGPDLLTAVATGQADVGLLTYTYLFQALDQGIDLTAIASNVRGGTRILISNSLQVPPGDYGELKKLAEARAAAGQKLKLIGSKPSINYTLGYLSLEQNGMDVEQLFDFQDVADFSLHAQMLNAGAADLVVTGEPGAAQAVVNNWGRTFDYPYNTPAGALNTEFLAKKSFVTDNPNTAKAFVKAVSDASAYLAQNKEENVSDVVQFTGLEPTVAREALNNVTPDVRLNVDAAKALAKTLFEQNLVKKNYAETLDQHVETGLLEP